MAADAPPDADRPLRHLIRAGGELIGRHRDIFATVVETTRMPMIVTDARRPDNPIAFANEAFLTMTGYSAQEVVGSNCRFLQGPETDPATVAELRNAIAERREHATEILNYRKDGYSFWNALFVSPVFDADGELIYFFGSQLDVTRRREAEDALRQAQKMEALGRLTGGIAHDFNNLLQVMVGYLELIDNGLKKPDMNLPKLQRGLSNARNAADRASSLTQQLLAFSRKQRLEGRVINLNELVNSIRDLADRTLGDDVAMEVRLSPDLANCRVDPTQVEVALLNILINSRDAMDGRAEKHVTIETRNLIVDRETQATHRALAPGRYATIAVTDTGGGMPDHVVERIMDPFFTPKEEGNGTGLGLSMLYGFARQSGGLAQIDSVKGQGTKVSIYFPSAEGTATPPRSRGRAIDRPGTETILLVQNRGDVAELARAILTDQGYTIVRAADAAAALEEIETRKTIDLLLSDLIMPGDMNGVALAREARRRRPHLKVLLTTGYAEASLERTDAGGTEFDVLNKPYGRSELARKVRILLDGPTGVS